MALFFFFLISFIYTELNMISNLMLVFITIQFGSCIILLHCVKYKREKICIRKSLKSRKTGALSSLYNLNIKNVVEIFTLPYCVIVCVISLTSGQLINELFPDWNSTLRL